MKKIFFLSLYALLTVLFISSCGADSQSTVQENVKSTAVEIPELLDRNPELRQGKEWDQVQSQYVQFRNEVRQNKQAEEARWKMAQLFINEARVTGEHGYYYPAALNTLEEALAGSDLDQDLRFRLLSTKASILLSLHQFAAGLEAGEEAVKLNPYNAGVYGILVDGNVELGRYEEAVKMADKMVSIRPDLRSYSRVSYLREIYGDWQGAIEAMQMAVQAGFPGYEQTAWTQLTLGNLYAEYGDKAEARRQYESVLVNRPDYPFAIAAIARLEMDAKNYEEAERLLKKAAGIIPEFSFYQDLAEIYRANGRKAEFDQTIEELFEMIADDEASGHLMDLEKAAIYADLLEDYDQALQCARIAFEQRPENIDVNRILADIYFRAGQPEQARPFLVAAGRTNSQKPSLIEMQNALAMR